MGCGKNATRSTVGGAEWEEIAEEKWRGGSSLTAVGYPSGRRMKAGLKMGEGEGEGEANGGRVGEQLAVRACDRKAQVGLGIACVLAACVVVRVAIDSAVSECGC